MVKRKRIMGATKKLYEMMIERHNSLENHFKILEEEYYMHQVEQAEYLDLINDGRYTKKNK